MADGLGLIDDLTDGLSDYMADQGFDSVPDMVGLALASGSSPTPS